MLKRGKRRESKERTLVRLSGPPVPLQSRLIAARDAETAPEKQEDVRSILLSTERAREKWLQSVLLMIGYYPD